MSSALGTPLAAKPALLALAVAFTGSSRHPENILWFQVTEHLPVKITTNTNLLAVGLHGLIFHQNEA